LTIINTRPFKNRIDIDQRSDAVNNREVFGHWEADTIIGKAHRNRPVA
jgi:IS30 family transposase